MDVEFFGTGDGASLTLSKLRKFHSEDKYRYTKDKRQPEDPNLRAAIAEACLHCQHNAPPTIVIQAGDEVSFFSSDKSQSAADDNFLTRRVRHVWEQHVLTRAPHKSQIGRRLRGRGRGGDGQIHAQSTLETHTRTRARILAQPNEPPSP